MLRLLALLLAIGVPGVAAADPMELRGEANRGETVIHAFEHHGVHYEFRMVPSGGGWTIWIGDPMQRDRNYVTAVTLPLRGVNPAVVQGWHFRNADNTGPNKPGKGHVNAPQKKREFSFVLDAVSYQLAREASEILLRPEGRSEDDLAEAETRFKNIPKGHGVMWIEALELGNLVEGEQAHIERMAFRIQLSLP